MENRLQVLRSGSTAVAVVVAILGLVFLAASLAAVRTQAAPLDDALEQFEGCLGVSPRQLQPIQFLGAEQSFLVTLHRKRYRYSRRDGVD